MRVSKGCAIRRNLAITGTSLMLLLTSSCGGSAESTAEQEVAAPTPAATPTASGSSVTAAEPEVERDVEGTVDITDDSGYTYTLDFSATLGDGTSDITNSPPGETVSNLPFERQLTLTSTTPGRLAPFFPGDAQGPVFAPYYARDAPICAAFGDELLIDNQVEDYIGDYGKETEYCVARLDDLAAPSTWEDGARRELGEGETIAADAVGALQAEVTERDAEVIEALWSNEPEGWLIYFPGGLYPDFPCIAREGGLGGTMVWQSGSDLDCS